MSSIQDLINELRRNEVRLWAEEGRLKFSAPKDRFTPELKARVKASKQELLQFLIGAASQKEEVRTVIPVARDRQRLPASFVQQQIWFQEQLHGSGDTYHMPWAFRLDGELDQELFRQCLHSRSFQGIVW